MQEIFARIDAATMKEIAATVIIVSIVLGLIWLAFEFRRAPLRDEPEYRRPRLLDGTRAPTRRVRR